jgi:hypothetical protein
MEKNGVVTADVDLRLFDENRSRFPAAQLLAYAGKHVAWSPDGTRILASGATREEVDDNLEAVGVHFSLVVHDYIDSPLE